MSMDAAGREKEKKMWLIECELVTETEKMSVRAALDNDTFIHLTENKLKMDFFGDIHKRHSVKRCPLLTVGVMISGLKRKFYIQKLLYILAHA